MRISIVIPTFNRKDVLARTLPTLLAQDFPAEQYEVVVVVDGSRDGTSEWLGQIRPRCALRVLEREHSGPAAARNVGVRAARGELVLFLDDDFAARADLLRQHSAAHPNLQPRVVHGPVYVAPDSARSIIRHVTESFYESYYRRLDGSVHLQHPQAIGDSIAMLSSLANSSVSRKLLLEAGGFDENIRAAEDLELGLRLWKMKARFEHCPAAAVEEFYVKSSWQYLRGQARALGWGDLLVSEKHAEYRPYCWLSSLEVIHPAKRWLRGAAARLPWSPLAWVAWPLSVERLLYRFAPLRRAAVCLLGAAESIVRIRAACSHAGSWKALQSQFARRCPVLMYHRIGPERTDTDPGVSITPQQFARQMAWLHRHGYTPIRATDWLRWLREGCALPQKPILLTFDDAYEESAQHALPLLERYGWSALIFVVTQRLAATNTWDEVQGSGTLRLMSAEQIRAWANKGFEFGAHSRTHPDLTSLDPSACAAEVVGSRDDLSALLGTSIDCFAYPFGECNPAAHESVRAAFALGFGTDEGLNHLRSDPHLLRRCYVSPQDSLLVFAMGVRWGKSQWWRKQRARFTLRSRWRKLLAALGRFGSRERN